MHATIRRYEGVNPNRTDELTKKARVAADWMRDEKLEAALPYAPKITSGTVIAHQNGVPVVA